MNERIFRSLLVHRAIVQRMADAGEDPYGHDAPGAWEDQFTLFCLLTAKKVEDHTDDGRIIHLVEAEVKVGNSAAVRLGDRLTNVTDRLGNIIMSGPLEVVTDEQRIGYRNVGIKTAAEVVHPPGGGGIGPIVHGARYVGWSRERNIDTALLAAADSRTQNNGTLPSTSETLAYVFYALPHSVGHVDQLFIGNNAAFHAPFIERAGVINDANGAPLVVGVTAARQGTSIAGQDWRLEFS